MHPGDRELIRHMLRQGQRLATRPRETTHYLHYSEVQAAHVGAQRAEALGYAGEILGPPDGIPHWQVQASHTIFVSEETISPARRSLTAVAEETDGNYDGWDTWADEALDKADDALGKRRQN